MGRRTGHPSRSRLHLGRACEGDHRKDVAVQNLAATKLDLFTTISTGVSVEMGAWVAAKLKRVPFVTEVRDLWPESIVAVGAVKDGALIRWLEKLAVFLYLRADLVVAVTATFAEHLVRKGVPVGRVVVIENGLDATELPCTATS